MALAESYTLKTSAIPAYFDAILDAQPPERFSLKFLENLGFTSTNDRLFIGILKDLGFLNRDGAPQKRYFDFLDRPQAKAVVAEGIREAFSDLFAINTKAQEFTVDQTKNKLRTLFGGKKTDLVISHIARTFKALTDYADFSTPKKEADSKNEQEKKAEKGPKGSTEDKEKEGGVPPPPNPNGSRREIDISALQYHVNIVLPETRDQAVYDAIFRSLRDHLG
ncbi:MAG TPA: DUF5343 domain-containing protein [Chthoniobacterales bacterium]|nr:DUF5343 domain-containing protein [Chthoniobacterales bacterium]